MSSRRRAVLAALVCALVAAAAAVRPAPQSGRAADYVMVLMLDGTRPDVLRRVQGSNIRGLARSGVTYLQARTCYPSQTRVAFVSLPTGSHPGSHGIVGGDDYKDAAWQTQPYGNDDPIAAQALVARGTMFEDATTAGLTSLYAAVKGYELVGARGATWTINGKKTLDQEIYKNRYQPAVGGSAERAARQKLQLSRQLVDQTLALVREKKPNLVVVNLSAADYTAHAFGPSSPYYPQAIEYLDSLVGELVRAYDRLGIRQRTSVIVSADHGFTDVDKRRLVAAASDPASAQGHRLTMLAERGIEHYVTNTGGSSMGVYIRDKARVPEAVAALRVEPWAEAIYCEDAAAHCDQSLTALHSFFPGRSPELMVDLDDDSSLNFPNAGQHGSLRPIDMYIPLVLSGAGVAQGRVLGKAELVDIAPTVLRLLGVEAKRLHPDGRILEEALAR
jgi:predicted AlkP superfamily pyrophosphatase or phosphodiesterase